MDRKFLKYGLFFAFLALFCQMGAQNPQADYQNYPLIKYSIESIGLRDYKTIEKLKNDGHPLSSRNSDRRYAIESLTEEKAPLPGINYYGVFRSEDGGASLIRLDSSSYDALHRAYVSLEERLLMELSDTSATTPVIQSFIRDSLYLFCSLNDNTGRISLKDHFDSLVVISPDGVEYRFGISALEKAFNETLFVDRPVLDSSRTGPPKRLVPERVKDSITWEDLLINEESLRREMAQIQAPAIVFISEKDTLAQSFATEYLNSIPDEQKDLMKICLGGHLIKLKKGLLKQLENQQEIKVDLELSSVIGELLFVQNDSLLLPLKKGDSLSLVIEVPRSILEEYFIEGMQFKTEHLITGNDYTGAIDYLNECLSLCKENNISIGKLEKDVQLVFSKYAQHLSDIDRFCFDTLVYLKNLWQGHAPEDYVDNARVDAYNVEYANAFSSSSGTALITYFSKWKKEVPESSLYASQPGKLAYSRYLDAKNRNWQEACRQLSLAKKLAFKTKAEDHAFCRNKEILVKRQQMATASKDGSFQQVYSIGIKEKVLYERSPEHRLMLAEAAWKTGNLKDAYSLYRWFDKNWNRIPEGGPDYDSYLEILGQLAFVTGDFSRAFSLSERNYMNSSTKEDLYKTLNAKRTFYVSCIMDLYVLVKSKTGAPLLPYFDRYKPAFVEGIHELSAGEIPESPCSKPIRTSPVYLYCPEDNSVHSLAKLSKGKSLVISQQVNSSLDESRAVLTKLFQTGFDGNSYNRLLTAEKEACLKLFGKSFKSLIGELYSFSGSSAFEAEMKRYVKASGVLKYVEYSVDESIVKVGECPPKEVYKDLSYLEKMLRIVDYENTRLSFKGLTIDEIVVPLRENGKKIGYIRVGLNTGEL